MLRRTVFTLLIGALFVGCDAATPAEECTVCTFSSPWFTTCDQVGAFSGDNGRTQHCEVETGARLQCKSPIECCNAVGLHYNGSGCVESLRPNPPAPDPDVDAEVVQPSPDATIIDDAEVEPEPDQSVPDAGVEPDMFIPQECETDDDCPETYTCRRDVASGELRCVSPCGGPCPPGTECIPVGGNGEGYRCGQPNQCPRPRVLTENFSVLPLDVILLDASSSTDPDGANGRPILFEWTIVSRPEGSVSSLVEELSDPFRPANGGEVDNPTSPQALFFVDLAGTYIIELRVVDDQGLTAPSPDCPQSPVQVRVQALPDEDIHLQLVWNTPADDDQTDEFGADVDIHFMHPRGAEWFRSPWDCHYANGNPDWGEANRPDDNPSLDIDDTNGAGPENINLDNPEDTQVLGRPYRVGVHYYRSEGRNRRLSYGPSDVTLRVYLGGELAGEFTRQLVTAYDLWEVVNIHWPGAANPLQPVDLVIRQEPQ